MLFCYERKKTASLRTETVYQNNPERLYQVGSFIIAYLPGLQKRELLEIGK